MKVAIVHHHLDPGGVTRVIRAASAALAGAGVRVVILAGRSADGGDFEGLPVQVVEGLDYAAAGSGDRRHEDAARLVARLRSAATMALDAAPDVWHFHNHSLGKNPGVSVAAVMLAEAGERVLLQIHDLAEDGRPALHAGLAGFARLYPFGARTRLVFINERDRSDFIEAGLPPAFAALLPNPIDAQPLAPAQSGTPPLLFAPLRAIRRKNLGELVLLAALAPGGTRLAVSRAPRDALALAIHDRWRSFAIAKQLPLEFDVSDRLEPAAGAGKSFHDWLAQCSHIIGTSVSEGFGMPLLEAAAWGRPFIGRSLPRPGGVQAAPGDPPWGHCYETLEVPTGWLDEMKLRRAWRLGLRRHHAAYGRWFATEQADAALDRLLATGSIDFGRLPESLQEEVIEHIITRPAMADELLVEHNGGRETAATWLARVLERRDLVADASRLAPWSPDRHRDALLAMYRDLLTAPSDEGLGFVDVRRVLDIHLDARHFHPLLSFPEARAWPSLHFRAVIFDVYGTLLVAPAGGVKPDPAADPGIREILRSHEVDPPDSPTLALHHAVRRHHAASPAEHPEVDLRELWREVLDLPPGTDTETMTIEIQNAWQPARPMPDAAATVACLARAGIAIGILSNAQCDTLAALGPVADPIDPGLTILSYQHGIAKPSPALFRLMVERLAARGIRTEETLFVGNDPLHDIAPARAAGFATALFIGHPESLRPGPVEADHVFDDWRDLQCLVG